MEEAGTGRRLQEMRGREMRRCALLVCVAVPTTVAMSAHGSTIQLFIDPAYGSTENTGATATVCLEFTEVASDDFLTVTIANTTLASIGSSLTAVGFELPEHPSLAVAFAPGGTSVYFDELDFDVSVSPGWLDAPDGYDLMITGDGSFEGGNAQNAPTEGETQIVQLSLGDTGLTPQELAAEFRELYNNTTDPYAIARFQAVGPDGEDSDKVLGITPEPATAVLLGVGGLAVLARRRRSSLK